jgi:hypothetical protein
MGKQETEKTRLQDKKEDKQMSKIERCTQFPCNCGEKDIECVFVYDDISLGIAFNIYACCSCGMLYKEHVWRYKSISSIDAIGLFPIAIITDKKPEIVEIKGEFNI